MLYHRCDELLPTSIPRLHVDRRRRTTDVAMAAGFRRPHGSPLRSTPESIQNVLVFTRADSQPFIQLAPLIAVAAGFNFRPGRAGIPKAHAPKRHGRIIVSAQAVPG